MRKLSIFFKAPRLKINGSVLRRIGISFFQKGAYHLEHPFDFLRRLRMDRRRFYIQGFHVFFALFDIALGDHGGLHAFLFCFFDDLIVHIRKIGNIIDLPALVLHISSDRIKYDHRPGIADMDQVIDRRSAHIHAHLSRLMWFELFFFPR